MAPQPDYLSVRAKWRETGNPFFPCEADVDGQKWTLRLNEWPEEPLAYTLMIGGREVLNFNEWPSAWLRPR